MKKLMIALGAAASMAWCANAVESQVVSGGTFVSGTDFTGLTTGATLTKAQETTGSFDGVVFWKSVADELSSTIKEKEDPSDKYLAVDETEVLERTMNGVNGTPQSLLTSSVYFTADVQFTASDETSGAGMVTTGDKLLVWLRATEAVEADPEHDIEAVPATTNLIITAAAGAAGTAATDYIVDSSVVIDPARWYTLTIKVVKDGIENYETAKFTVELNGEPLSATAAGAESATSTFNSLVGSGDAAATITSVGFKGTGSLDNLEFGTFTEVAQVCTVSVSVTDEAQKMLGIMVDQTDVQESLPYEKEYTIASGAKSTIVVTVDDGYVVTYNNTTYQPVEGDCTIEIDLSAAEPNSTVNVALAVVEAGSEPPAANYQVTITPGANSTVTDITVNAVSVGTTLTQAADGSVIEVTFTAVEGYSFNGQSTSTKSATVNGAAVVITGDAATQSSQTTWPAEWNGGNEPSAAILANYETWSANNDPTAEGAEDAFLLGVASNADDKTLAVTTIVVEGGKVKITSNRDLNAVNGVPYILTGNEPNAVNTPAAATVDDDGNIQYQPGLGETKKFYKIGVGYAVPPAQE